MQDNSVETAKRKLNNANSLVAVEDSVFALFSYILPLLNLVAPQIQERFSEKISKNDSYFKNRPMQRRNRQYVQLFRRNVLPNTAARRFDI